MSTVQQAIEVSAPLHAVYEQFASFESYPRFMTGMERVTQLSGDRVHMVMDLDGQRREFDAQITECRPDERVAWQTMDGPMLAERITLRPIGGDRTQVIAELEADVRGLMPSDAHAQESLDRRLKADLMSFKRYIEQGTGSPSPRDMPRRSQGGGGPAGGGDAAIGTATIGSAANGNIGRAGVPDNDPGRTRPLDGGSEQRGSAGDL